jgi:endonuclease/exonuclease/phosphatase family metal-dependent hydrolase
MKIMFWNLRNLGTRKLNNSLGNVAIANAGMGNTILDYIVRINTGNAVWAHATSQVPVDVFVIIELKSGGVAKGAAGTGACLQVLPSIQAAMNAAAPLATHQYAWVAPQVVGYHEVVGILYNTHVFNGVANSGALRNNAGNFLNPRTAFWAELTVTASNTPLHIVGIHGPTSKPQTGDYKNACVFTNDLGTVARVNQAANNPKQRLCVGGDFNVDPLQGYKNGNGQKARKISAFNSLQTTYNYSITLPNGTLTSVRDRLANNLPPPANYLSQPYDNIVFMLPGIAPPVVRRVDIIGNAPTYVNRQAATFNAASRASDHLPMTIEW